MHSTPNDGYNCYTEVHHTGCDIERLKDKAVNHGERITRNEERIKCLSGRVHRLECAPCGKESPGCKPDSCGKALRRHLSDPDAHEELFDQKVDKKDGCRLICEEELQGIYGALDDRYPKEKLYTQQEVDRLLSKKMDKDAEELDWILLEPSGEYYNESTDAHAVRYAKSSSGLVFINGIIRKPEAVNGSEIIGVLPEGYRPQRLWNINIASYCGDNIVFQTVGHIQTTGEISTGKNTPAGYITNNPLLIDTIFMAQ